MSPESRGRLIKALRRAGVGAALAAIVAGGLVLVAEWQIRKTVDGRLFETLEALPDDTRPVAIVPGARVFEDGTPSHALEDRLSAALDLYQAGRVEKILVSGDHGREGYDEVNAMHSWLLRHGVPSDAVYMDHAGFRTLDTMVRAARVFGVTTAVICTQRFHLPRSVYLARRAGIDAVGLEADRRILRAAFYNTGRESLARVRAWLDVHVLRTEPRFLGPRVPIDGPADATHDGATRRGGREA